MALFPMVTGGGASDVPFCAAGWGGGFSCCSMDSDNNPHYRYTTSTTNIDFGDFYIKTGSGDIMTITAKKAFSTKDFYINGVKQTDFSLAVNGTKDISFYGGKAASFRYSLT